MIRCQKGYPLCKKSCSSSPKGHFGDLRRTGLACADLGKIWQINNTQEYICCVYFCFQKVPGNCRWITQPVSYQEALGLTETKVTALKNQMRVASENGSGPIATVCYESYFL